MRRIKPYNKYCGLCNHSFDYHRVRVIADNKLQVRCHEWVNRGKPDRCGCNGGFNTTVVIKTIVTEEENDKQE